MKILILALLFLGVQCNADSNIALKKPVTVSSQYPFASVTQYPPSAAVDGIVNAIGGADGYNRFVSNVASAASPQWLEVDLGAIYLISSVKVATGKPGGSPISDFEIQTKAAAYDSYQTLPGSVAVGNKEFENSFAAPPRLKIQYVRFLCKRALPDGFCRIRELEVYGMIPPPNVVPMASAGSDQVVQLPLPDGVALTGAGSDSDGEIRSYAWSQASGPNSSILSPVDAASTKMSGLIAGSYVMALTVTDNEGATGTATTTVTVKPSPTPVPTPTPTPVPTATPTPTPIPAVNGQPSDFKMATFASSKGQLFYYLWVPDNYTPTKKYPIVVFEHGNGVNGPDKGWINEFYNVGANAFVSARNRVQNPSFVLLPKNGAQSVTGSYSNYIADGEGGMAVATMELVRDLIKNQYAGGIDPDRVYVTGMSQGGGLTEAVMNLAPTELAAAAPLSGWVSGTMPSTLKNLAVWVGHSADDGTVGVNGGDSIVNNLIRMGNRPIYSRFARGGHGGPWAATYNNPFFVDWIMKQRRGVPAVEFPVNCSLAQSGAIKTTGSFTATGQSAKNPAYINDPVLGRVMWLGLDYRYTGATEGFEYDSSVSKPGVATGIADFSTTIAVKNNPSYIGLFCTGSTFSGNGGEIRYPAPALILQK